MIYTIHSFLVITRKPIVAKWIRLIRKRFRHLTSIIQSDAPRLEHVPQVGPTYAWSTLLIQGRPQLRLQKSYQFQVQKTNPKTSLLYLLVLIMRISPFLFMLMQACNRGASRLAEAWAKPGEAWARPRHGRKTYRHKDKARLMGTRNYIILLLKS